MQKPTRSFMNDLFSRSQNYMNAETVHLLGSYVLSVVAFILILIAGRYVATWVRNLIRGGLDRPEVDTTLTKFAGNFAYYGIFLLAILAGLNTVGVETASVVAVLAAVGFAVGLALQGTLANFAAGVMLLVFRPFKVGDYVEIAGETGFVKDLSLFFTRLTTRDNRLVAPPSGIFSRTTSSASTATWAPTTPPTSTRPERSCWRQPAAWTAASRKRASRPP